MQYNFPETFNLESKMYTSKTLTLFFSKLGISFSNSQPSIRVGNSFTSLCTNIAKRSAPTLTVAGGSVMKMEDYNVMGVILRSGIYQPQNSGTPRFPSLSSPSLECAGFCSEKGEDKCSCPLRE